MLQFVSNNLDNSNTQYHAFEAIVPPKLKSRKSDENWCKFPQGRSFGHRSCNGILAVESSQGSCSIDHWADVKVRFKRDLRTREFQGGEIWIEPRRSSQAGVIMMATRRSSKQLSLPNLRLALRRLCRWADRNKVASVALVNVGRGVEISDHQLRRILYEQLGDSACQFWAEESGFNNSLGQRKCTTNKSRFPSIAPLTRCTDSAYERARNRMPY